MLGFGKDKKDKVPVEEVRKLSSKGKSEREIIEKLRDEDYSNKNINRALNQVLKFKVSGAPGEGGREREGGEKTGRRGRKMPATTGGGGEFIAPPPQTSQPEFPERTELEEEEGLEEPGVIELTEEEEISLEEIIEEIISEKWKEVDSKLDKLSNNYSSLEAKLDDFKERLDRVEERHQEEKKELREELEETTTHIEGIESRIGSIEKAFKEFLPTLTENVRSLSDIVQKLKGKTGESVTSEKEKGPSALE